MKFIPDKNEELPRRDFLPKIKRRSIRDVLTVCPICFSPSKPTTEIFIPGHYTCTNKDCGWNGTIPIEVTKEDYEKFRKERGINETDEQF